MAKGARASTRQRNNAVLRAKIFGPASDARTARLSAKLQDLVNAPKPEEEKKMEVDGEGEGEGEGEAGSKDPATKAADEGIEAMQWTGISSSSRKPKNTKSSGRVVKKSWKRKPRNEVVFRSEAARKKRQTKGRKG